MVKQTPESDIIVEFSTQPGLQPVSISMVGKEQLKEKSEVALQQAFSTIRVMTKRLEQLRDDIPMEFKQVEVEFGIKLDWEVGALLSKAGTEANLSIKLIWERDKPTN